MPNLLARLGIELPVVQAGMGGGLAGPELAAAVSQVGGLGTIGMLGPKPLGAELAAGPLYAGECVARINDIRPAAELVRALTP